MTTPGLTTAALSLSNNNNSAVQTTAAAATSTQQGFCFSCGFNFGHIADGVDDTTMGMLLVVMFMFLVFSPCIAMSICWLCNKRKAAKKRYAKVRISDDDADNENEDA
jgi:uncharacterized membrane protein YeiB